MGLHLHVDYGFSCSDHYPFTRWIFLPVDPPLIWSWPAAAKFPEHVPCCEQAGGVRVVSRPVGSQVARLLRRAPIQDVPLSNILSVRRSVLGNWTQTWDDPNTTTTISEFISRGPIFLFWDTLDAAPNFLSTQLNGTRSEKTQRLSSEAPSSAVLMRHQMQTFFGKLRLWLCLGRPSVPNGVGRIYPDF